MTVRRAASLRVVGQLTLLVAVGPALVLGSSGPGPVFGPGAGNGSPVGAAMASTDGQGTGAVIGRVSVSVITLGLELVPRPGRRGQTTQARASIANVGPTTLDQVSVRLLANSDQVVARPGAEQIIRRLKPGAREAVSWNVCAMAPGAYELRAWATVVGSTVASPARTLVIAPGTTC